MAVRFTDPLTPLLLLLRLLMSRLRRFMRLRRMFVSFSGMFFTTGVIVFSVVIRGLSMRFGGIFMVLRGLIVRFAGNNEVSLVGENRFTRQTWMQELPRGFTRHKHKEHKEEDVRRQHQTTPTTSCGVANSRAAVCILVRNG